MSSKRSQNFTTFIAALGLLYPVSAFGADPTPAAKQAFLERKTIYLLFEITETGTREFGVAMPKHGISDAAHRITRTARFEVPLDKPMPGINPVSSMPLTPADMEKGRFTGWSTAPPDFAVVEKQMTSGKIDLSDTSLYLPVEFSIDEVVRSRYRDHPSHGWATDTTTSKGRGVAYVSKHGSLACDLKKMTCDLNSVSTTFLDGTDLVTVATTSDVPGFEAKRETVGPKRLLPVMPPDLAKRLIGFPITLPDPITLAFSGPSANAESGTTVAVKVTLSAKPAPKAAGGAR